MTVKRTLTLIFGLIIVSILAKQLVWYTNPPSRLHGVGYEYIYSTLNYIQFFVLFLIPSSAAFFLYRLDSKILNKFYDRASAAVKKMFLAGLESKEAVLSFAIVMFWIFNLMENVFFRYLVERKKSTEPFHMGLDFISVCTPMHRSQASALHAHPRGAQWGNPAPDRPTQT